MLPSSFDFYDFAHVLLFSPSVCPMAKVARLTWGLSLCKLRIPSFVLDAGVCKQCVSSSFSTASAAFNVKTHPISGSRKVRASPQASIEQTSPSSNEDIELALIIDSPQLASRCSKGKFKLVHAGGKW